MGIVRYAPTVSSLTIQSQENSARDQARHIHTKWVIDSIKERIAISKERSKFLKRMSDAFSKIVCVCVCEQLDNLIQRKKVNESRRASNGDSHSDKFKVSWGFFGGC